MWVLEVMSVALQSRTDVFGNNFNDFPTNTTAKAGDVVRFTCQIDSVPKAVITWERNREPLPQNSRTLALDSGDLYLLDTHLTDEGTYRCTATNVINKKQRVSPEISLKVIARSQEDSPQVLQFLNPHFPTVQLHQGKTLVLPCAVVGSLSPEITWTFKPLNSTESIVLNHTTSALSLLTIQNVTLENTGNYTCSVSAPDRDPILQVVEVDVWVPPYFKANGTPISESHPAAKTVRFKCDAQGIPKPEITWFKDGERLEINGRFKQRASELVLLNAVTTDSGLYQCVVHSKAGEIWAAGRLQVNASRLMPDPPHSLSCITLSSSQIQLTWEPPQRLTGDKIVAYSIHIAPTGGDERQEVKVNRTFTVDKLAAYTNYTFYVRAYNGKSASDPSTRIVCQTGEGVPQAAPTFEVEITSSSSARVSWIALPSEKARGPISEYKIQWRRLGHPSSNLEEVGGDVMEYTITGLQPGQTYEVRVLAATKKGWPDLTDDQLLWKTINMPTFGPQNVPEAPIVNLTAINSTCIEVTWCLPADNEYPATEYKLFYRKQTSQQIGPVLLPANVTRYVLEGLDVIH
ncbi:Tyrosine-protein phosphatase Lar [Gryllus bimaculatus]|nr:Tyrosine-protein phosphatase Lar [Gryllus bimaculatus]